MCFNTNKILSGSKMLKKNSYEIFNFFWEKSKFSNATNYRSRVDILTSQIPAYEVYHDNNF
jgi:hypothetical protein